jgi:hypothetical protein
MSPETILLINLAPDEILFLENLVHDIDPHANVVAVASLGRTGEAMSLERLVLVAFRPDARDKHPSHTVQRIKHLAKHTVALLLLITPEQMGKVKGYFRAGVDEYWILPMDAVVFPQRLQVMLEWGRSSLDEEPFQEPTGYPSQVAVLTWCKGLLESARRLLRWSFPKQRSVPDSSATFAGRWNRIRSLGFGGFGEVCLVREEGSGKLAVAKIPHNAAMNSRFIREAAILRRLAGHPNCVQLQEVIKEKGKVILIEEYVEGATLLDLLDQGMERSAKEKVFLEVLDIMARAHGRKIMHRDIKPENIIITPSGVSKLLDFGTGKDLTLKSISSTVVGSRPYMAPEQIAGKSQIASDVWAMGILLYLFATGLLPFYDENEKTLMDMILECDPDPPGRLEPDLPAELERIILRCLQKDTDMRFRDAGELRRELLEYFPHFGNGQTLPSV